MTLRHPIHLLLILSVLSACSAQAPTTSGPIASRNTGKFDKDSLLSGGNGLISNNAGGLISNNAGGLISNNAGGLISNNAGGLIGKVKMASGLISNNAGGLISNNAGGLISNNAGGLISDKGMGYQVLGIAEKPLVGFKVTIVDGGGRVIIDENNKPYTATTDAQGNYNFTKTPRGRNLLVRIELPEPYGNMMAYLPDVAAGASRTANVDAASTLVMGYILDRYVKGDEAVLAKLPAAAEADTRAKALAAMGDNVPVKSFKPAEIVAGVDQLRGKDTGFDDQVKYVESLLAAGLKDVGDGMLATQVALASPMNFVQLNDGSFLIAERNGQRIRRIWPNGTITTFAGKDGAQVLGDGGPAVAAKLDRPTDVLVGKDNAVYYSDYGQDRVRRIDLATGMITTVMGKPREGAQEVPFKTGPAAKASEQELGTPNPLGLDAQGRLVARFSRGVFRLEADGSLSQLQIDDGLTIDDFSAAPDGTLYGYCEKTGGFFKLDGDHLVSESSVPPFTAALATKFCIGPDNTWYATAENRVMALRNGAWTQVATAPELIAASGMVVTANNAYVLDAGTNRLWGFGKGFSGTPKLLAGLPVQAGDGIRPEALSLNRPTNMLFDAQDNLYVADSWNGKIWQRRPDGLYYRFAGSERASAQTTDIGDGGPARDAKFGFVGTFSFNPKTGDMLASDLPLPLNRLRLITKDGQISTYKVPAAANMTAPVVVHYEADGSLIAGDLVLKKLARIKPDGSVEPLSAFDGKLDSPSNMLSLPDGSLVVSDAKKQVIYKLKGTELGVLAGTLGTDGFDGDGGPATGAKLSAPMGMTLDPKGRLVFADSKNDRIRRVDLATGEITTIAGVGSGQLEGSGTDDSLKEPSGVAFDKAGNLYIADSAHNQIKVLKADKLKP